MIDKPFLTGSTQLEKVSLNNLFLYHLNYFYPFLLAFRRYLPPLAQATYYGDLQNAIDALGIEVDMKISRIQLVFDILKAMPLNNQSVNLGTLLQDLNCRHFFAEQEALQHDISLIFQLQNVLAIESGHYHTLSSLADAYNDFQVKQYIKFCNDECEDSQQNFTLIAQDYMRSKAIRNLHSS